MAARKRFSVFDSDSHVVEPREVWEEYLEPEYLEDSAPRGRVVKAGTEERPYRVYLPPSYDDSQERYPLLVVQEGEGGESARMERTLDHLIGTSVAPVLVVFLPRLKREHDMGAMTAYAHWVRDELVPHLDRTYRTLATPDTRAVLGAGSGAPISAYAVFHAPGVFRQLAVQSFFLKGLFGKLGAGAFSLTPEARKALLTRIGEGPR